MKNALELVVQVPPATPAANPSQSRLGRIAWCVVGVMAVALAAISFVHFRQSPPERRVITSNLLPPEGATALTFRSIRPTR